MTGVPTPLAAIAEMLAASGITVELEQVDQGLPLERLKLLLLTDDGGRDIVLQLVVINDIDAAVAAAGLGVAAAEDDDEDAADDDEDAILLHFSVVLPFKVAPGAAADTMRVVLTLNRLLPVGAFGYGEADGGLYLGYQLALEEWSGLTPLVLEEVVNMLGFAVDNYGQVLEAVASGRSAAAEVLAQMRDAGIEPPPVGDPPVMRPPA